MAVGSVAGTLGVLLQSTLLRFGVLSPLQLFLVWVTFVVLGIGLALANEKLVGWLFGIGKVRHLAGGFVPVVFFVAFPFWNTRGSPDVYLLVSDATRADHLSVYGYPRDTTPFLKQLARESVVFTNSIAQGTHTIVTTPSILASCYPSQHGMVDYSSVLADRFTLISEYLKSSGYKTFGYATNPHLGPSHGFSQGFDSYQHARGWDHTPAKLVNERFLAWLDGQGDEPVFSFLFYIDPHNPYRPPPEYQRLFDPDWGGEPISNWKHQLGRPEEPSLRNLVAQYDGAIAYWDAELRRLVEALEQRDRWRNALFVYTSDHGEEFWEHGFWGHNKIPYEGLARVPLMISFPVPIRFPPLPRVDLVVDGVVSSVDIVPTILDYLGVEPDETASGNSALSMVFGRDSGKETVAYGEEILKRYGPYDIRSVRTRTHKYIRMIDFEGNREYGDLFFDLTSDPEEQRNLVQSHPREAAEFRQIVEQFMVDVATDTTAAETIELEPEQLERLRALGYMGD